MITPTTTLSAAAAFALLSLIAAPWATADQEPAPPGTPPQASADPTETKTPQPEVWLCVGARVLELLREDAEWPFVKQNLSGLKLYIDQIDKAPPERLAALVELVRQQRYQIAVECGCCLDFGPMDDTNGEWSARLELAKINK